MATVMGSYVKYVYGGACGGDTWSIGLYMRLVGMTGTPTPTQMNTDAGLTLAGFNTSIWSAAAALKAINGTGVTLQSAKNYCYTDGVLVAQGSASITAVPGTATNGTPFFQAFCVSLLSNTPGRSGRGRMYLPATGCLTSTATGLMASSQATLITNLAAWIATIKPNNTNYPGTPATDPVIVSRQTGLMHAITSIRADNMPDTQHGRTRKSLPSATWTGTV